MSEFVRPTDIRVFMHQQKQDPVSVADLPFDTTDQSPKQPLKKSGVEIMALREHHCRWPLVRAADEAQKYCGMGRFANSSYCATHAKISYVPSQSRQRMARAS